MIKERTEFYNNGDKRRYMNLVLREFLSLPCPEGEPAFTRANIECIRLVREYLEKASTFRGAVCILGETFKELGDEGDVYQRGVRRIYSSVGKQVGLVLATQHRLKEIPVERKYAPAIKYLIDDCTSRLDELYGVIEKGYIPLTPLAEYVAGKPGEFYKELCEVCDNVPIGEISNNENVHSYIQTVISKLRQSGEWEVGAKRYAEFRYQQFDRRRAEKQRMQQNYRDAQYAAAEEALQREGRRLSYDLEHMDNHRRTDLTTIINKMCNMQSPKLVMFAHAKSADAAYAYYYAEGNKTMLTKYLSNTTVVESDFVLPELLQQQVDAKKLVMHEIMLK